jgi:hypothetical protein
MYPFYRLILKRALSISWKNKWLWGMAFFAAFIGNGTVYEALIRSFNNLSEGNSAFLVLKEYSQMGLTGLGSLTNLQSLWQTDPSAFGITILTTILFLSVLALLLSFAVIGQGGVIRSIVNIDQGKNATLKSSIRSGVERFWPILEVNVIGKLVLLGALMFVMYLASLIHFVNPIANLILYIISFTIFIFFGIIIYFLTIYGTAFVILREDNAFRGLKEAWRIFMKNPLLNLEMGMLLFIINIVVAIAFFVAAFLILAPFFLVYIVMVFAGWAPGVTVLSTFITFLFITLLILMGSWYSTFQLGAWAILFEELALNGGKSKVVRVIEHVKKIIKRRS